MPTLNTVSNRDMLETKYKRSRNNLLLVVVFTVINLILLISKSNTYFLFSAYIPYAFVDMGMLLCGIYPAEVYGEEFLNTEFLDPSVFAIFIGIALVVVLLYLLSWIFSKKHKVGWLIFALVFFVIDTVALLVLWGVQMDNIIDIVFHAWVIISLSMGISANLKLKKLPLEEETSEYEELEEGAETEETEGEPQNSAIIRIADRYAKSRVLLEANEIGHLIIYRRIKRVNELVVDGNVYDEIQALIEVSHSLKAQIDGHQIEVGYDGRFYSYLIIDGQLVTRKLRLF
ncbi:MAG: hypothetical protein IJN93_06480 [Clostridia bacterium]|nr:hypothetical protein [Clostridia bacterium]